jgi:hypothetical protein
MVPFFGGPIPFGVSDDVITISMPDDDTLSVSVNAGRDNPGTGPNMTAFDQQDAFVSYFDIDDLSSITINALDGDDEIIIDALPAGVPLTINGNTGNDTFTIGGPHIDLIQSDVTIVGGSGSDMVRVSDIFSGSGHAYDIDTTEVRVDESLTISHNVQRIEIWPGLDDDSIDVNSLNSIQALEINSSLGTNDVTINVLSSPLVTSVLGKVDVHGGSGDSDTLTINDATHLAPSDYVITGTSVGREDIQPIDYDGIEHLHVVGGISASNYDIQSTSTPTTVTGGILADTFHVGRNLFGDPDLNDINASLRIEGGDNFAGEDTVLLNDTLGSNGAYVIQDELVTGNNFAAITLVDVHHATLNTSNLGVIVHVENAEGDTRYTVNGGFGDNTYHLAFGSKVLSNFANPLVINGGVNDDDLILYDDSSAGSFSYTVTENSIDRLLFGERSLVNTDIGVTFSSMTSVELHMTDQNSNVNVQSTNPSTKYIFHGNGGSDTLNLNRHTDDDDDPFVDIEGVAVTSAAMDIEQDGFEQLNLNLGDESNTVRVHRLHSPAAINLGLGDDWVLVTPDSENLSFIQYAIAVDGQGGLDRMHLLDGNYGADAQFTVTNNSIDRSLFGPLVEPGVTYLDLDNVRLFMGAGDNVVDIDSIAADTEYLFDGGLGDDTFYVNALPKSSLTLFGSVGEDHAVITGTAGDDEVSISAGFGTSDINMPNTETATFDGLGGADVLVGEGVVGSDEQFEVEASTAAGAGDLRIITTTPRGDFLLDLAFENTESLDVVGNLKEMDTATFIGTDLDDEFEINLGAAGTNDDPVLLFFQPGSISPLLVLRNYLNFGTLRVEGRDGADAFNVFVAPTGPGTEHRNLLIDGGTPSGPGNNGDELTVYWQQVTPTPPPADPPPSPGSPVVHNQGLDQFFADYDSQHRFTIDYVDIEQKSSKNANAAG